MARESKVYQFSEEEFKTIISTSYSYSECCRKCGLSDKGRHGSDMIKKRCSELNISTDHFKTFGSYNQQKHSLKDILVENSIYTNMTVLKQRLLNEKLLIYQCERCGNTGIWNGQPLTLQLDHINGNHNDNRIENLRFLCPNCHTQTETYGSRQRRAKSEQSEMRRDYTARS